MGPSRKRNSSKAKNSRVAVGILIDSSVLIAWERQQLDLESLVAEYREEDFAVSAVTASELLHGVHRATKPARRSQREAFVERLLSRMPVLAFDWSLLVCTRVWSPNLPAGELRSGRTI